MTAFQGDTISTYAHPLNDYTPVIDSTTDMPASAGNAAMAALAALTRTGVRAWVRMTINGSATPVLVAWEAMWKAVTATAPVLAHTGTGVCTVTFPTLVQDEVPITSPGYTGPQALNLRAGTHNFRFTTGAQSTLVGAVDVTSANVVTLRTFIAGAFADVGSALDVDVFVR